jgi:hypothetical protein
MASIATVVRDHGTDSAAHTSERRVGRRLLAAVVIGISLALPSAGALADHVFEGRVHEAAEEAQGWPDFDPSDMHQEVAITEAQQEAAAWEDFDPSDMNAEVAATKAQQEAATWPNFDSANIQVEGGSTETAGSPRMSQIAAYESESAETAVVNRGEPF